MRISVISDTHLGFAYGTERGEDSFLAFEEAINKSLDCDFIILAGDIFDSRMPNTETLTRAMEILRKPLEKGKGSRILDYTGREKKAVKPLNNGIPVAAIHGTHERRSKGLLNPIEALERAGFLTHLHCSGILLEDSRKEKAFLQGLSGIPDQYVTAVLGQWNPKPIADALNIFVLHQSVSPFIYAVHMVPLESLPKGFNLYINGHIHSPKKATYCGSPFIIPGSTVVTQVTRDNALGGFCIVEADLTGVKSVEWPVMENQRRAYYLEESDSLKQEMEKILSGNHKMKPIIKISVKSGDSLKQLEDEFSGRALVFFRKEAEDREFESKSRDEQAASVRDLGKKLLEKNLQKSGLDQKVAETVFELLLEKGHEAAVEFLKGSVK